MSETHGYATFGSALKAFRKQAELTQEELGRRVSYSREYIAYLESNRRKPDVNGVASLFIPALGLQRDPARAGALIELAARSRGGLPRDFGITIVHERTASAPVEAISAANHVPQPDTLAHMLSWYVQMRPEAALEMARAMGPYWRANGQFSEARAWLRSILAHSTSPTVSRGEALLHAADFARHQGDLTESIALCREACALFRANGDERGLCTALCQLAWAHYDTNCRQSEAQAALEQGLAIARRIGYAEGIVEALGALAHMRMAAAATHEARGTIAAMLEEALACGRDLGDPSKLGFLSQQVAILRMSDSQIHGAHAMFSQAAEYFREAGDQFSLAWTQAGLGECSLLLGQMAEARAAFEAAYHTFEASAGREGKLILTHHLARLDLCEGRLAKARDGFLRCIAQCNEAAYPQMRARCVAGLSGVAIRAGQPELGAHLLSAATRAFDALPPFLQPPDRAEYAALADEARSALGLDAFERAWSAPQREDDLLDQARAVLTNLPPARYRPRYRALGASSAARSASLRSSQAEAS